MSSRATLWLLAELVFSIVLHVYLATEIFVFALIGGIGSIISCWIYGQTLLSESGEKKTQVDEDKCEHQSGSGKYGGYVNLVVIFSIVLYIAALVCDVIFMNTDILPFEFAYWICLLLAFVGSVSCSTMILIKKSKERDSQAKPKE